MKLALRHYWNLFIDINRLKYGGGVPVYCLKCEQPLGCCDCKRLNNKGDQILWRGVCIESLGREDIIKALRICFIRMKELEKRKPGISDYLDRMGVAEVPNLKASNLYEKS